MTTTTTAAETRQVSGPVNGLIPALKPLYDYSWVVGLGAGLVVYLLLSLPVFGKTGDTPAS